MKYLRLEVLRGSKKTLLKVAPGRNLRTSLLDAGLSPYTKFTRKLNCGGRGICATCGVWIHKPEVKPTHWHDKLARKYGYSRLSCQVQVNTDMTIELDTEKKIWGKPKK